MLLTLTYQVADQVGTAPRKNAALRAAFCFSQAVTSFQPLGLPTSAFQLPTVLIPAGTSRSLKLQLYSEPPHQQGDQRIRLPHLSAACCRGTACSKDRRVQAGHSSHALRTSRTPCYNQAPRFGPRGLLRETA